MVKKLLNLIKNNWGLLVLIPILFAIIISSVKPNYFVMGWDNFSVSLNTKISLPRTFFATWREYRGLGVPSDSEVVDIFRQIIFIFISIFSAPELINQIYILGVLILGTLGVYILAKYLIQTLKGIPDLLLESGAVVASVFYLFNLNTLATFYLPMPMYVTRFALLPWLVFVFIKLIQKKKITRKSIFLLIIISLFGATSYLTATVFITTVLLLGIITITVPETFTHNLKILALFLLINAYWLLPFANYTLQKSSIVPTASTFVEVNEIQLNEAPHHFTWKKLLTFYPNFFYTQAKTLSTNESINLHPKVDSFANSSLESNFLLLFPVLYLTGCLIIISKPKSKYLRWIPLVLLMSLFMLRKEYSPLGSVYDWLGTNVPLFEVVFRFADTKFYPLLALAGSLAAGVAIIFVAKSFISLMPKILRPLLVFCLVSLILLPNIFIYATFFDGNFIAPLMYNQIPKPYSEIANHINNDPDNFRVLHLPIESVSYWKPYSWGYVGSSFLTFMLDKPLIDRTFEPASKENDQIDTAILQLAQNAENIKDEAEVMNRAKQLEKLLGISHIKYIILDETVTPDVKRRDTAFWGIFPTEGITRLVEKLDQEGSLLLKEEFKTPNKLRLYTVRNFKSSAKTKDEAEVVSSLHKNLQLEPFLSNKTAYFQEKELEGKIFPLQLSDLETDFTGTKTELHLPIKSTNLTLSTYDTSNTKNAFDVFLSKNKTHLIIGIKHKRYPLEIDNQTTSELHIPLSLIKEQQTQKIDNFVSDWHTLPIKEVTVYRINIGNITFPLSSDLTDKPKYFTTILTSQSPVEIRLLAPDNIVKISPSNFAYTEDPNCFKDQFEEYEYNLNITANSLVLSSQNGTTCITAPFQRNTQNTYLETEISYGLAAKNLDISKKQNTPSSSQKNIRKEIDKLETANYFNYCLMNITTGSCLNNHQAIGKQAPKNIIIPSVNLASPKTQILLSLPTINKQSNSLTINNLQIKTYKTVFGKKLGIPIEYSSTKTNSDSQHELSLQIPRILSNGSYYLNPKLDALKVYNKPCDNEDHYRNTKKSDSYTLQYTHGCQTGAYQELPFNNNNFYFWQISYDLQSGKTPKFLVKEDINTYKDEYLALNQDYQNDAYTFVYPQPGLNDTQNKLFTIFHQSDNQGILAIKDFNIIELPRAWQSLTITPKSVSKTFEKADVAAIKKIIPSLWKITLKGQSNSQNDYLLEFGQGYDQQWQLFNTSNPLLVFLDQQKSSSRKVKVNGLTNGWIIPKEELNDEETIFYAFYTPERLSVAGWILTLTTIPLSLLLPGKVQRKKKN